MLETIISLLRPETILYKCNKCIGAIGNYLLFTDVNKFIGKNGNKCIDINMIITLHCSEDNSL